MDLLHQGTLHQGGDRVVGRALFHWDLGRWTSLDDALVFKIWRMVIGPQADSPSREV